MPPTIHRPGALLEATTLGEGAPLLVLPGGPGFGHAYLSSHLGRALDSGYELLLYDPRGSGASSGHDVSERLTMADLVADADAVRAAGRAGRCDLIGHSFGGLVALYYALEHPGHVRRLVIVDGDPASRAEWEGFRGVLESRRTDEERRQLTELMTHSGWPADPDLVAEYFRVFLRPYFNRPELASELDFGFVSDSFEKFRVTSAALRADLGDWDLRDRLAEVGHPALLLYGAETIYPRDSVRGLRDALPNVRLEWIEGAGHFPFIERPGEFARVVAGFLGQAA